MRLLRKVSRKNGEQSYAEVLSVPWCPFCETFCIDDTVGCPDLKLHEAAMIIRLNPMKLEIGNRVMYGKLNIVVPGIILTHQHCNACEGLHFSLTARRRQYFSRY